MSLKIHLEIGHEATLRAKNTPEGFTHDWKIFVRGCDGANIHYYVEKVVFHLHETFQKPKRVIKEPPYSVKESGYAGFIVPVEVYFRTSGEPKKIKFSYDLTLQRTGPPLRKIKREKYVFTSPPDDLREKLLKGGAAVTSNSQESSENKNVSHEEKNQLISKPKLSGETPIKKPKFDPPLSNSFQDLFGTPITKTSKPPEPKTVLAKENKSSSKPDKERSAEKVKNKHSPHKDKEREKDKIERKEKKEEKKKDKERRERDRERNKEKSAKMDKSPKPSPSSPKSSLNQDSQIPQSSQTSTSDRPKEKDTKNEKDKKDKVEEEERKSRKERKEKDKEKHREGSKNETKNKESRNKDAASQGVDSMPSTSHLSPDQQKVLDDRHERKNERKDDRETDRKDKAEEKKHKHKKKDRKKEKKEDDSKRTKTSPKTESERTPEEPIHVVSDTSSPPCLEMEMSETDDFFDDSPQLAPSTSQHSIAKAGMSATLPQENSESTSGASSPLEGDIPEDYTLTDSARKRKRPASPDLEDSPSKYRREDGTVTGGKTAAMEATSENTLDGTNYPQFTYDPVTGRRIEHCLIDEDKLHMLLGLKDRINACRGTPMMEKVVDIVSHTGNFELTDTFDFYLNELDQDALDELMALLPPDPPSPSSTRSSSPETSPSHCAPGSPAQSRSPSPTRSSSRSPSRSRSPSPSPSPSPPPSPSSTQS